MEKQMITACEGACPSQYLIPVAFSHAYPH